MCAKYRNETRCDTRLFNILRKPSDSSPFSAFSRKSNKRTCQFFNYEIRAKSVTKYLPADKLYFTRRDAYRPCDNETQSVIHTYAREIHH